MAETQPILGDAAPQSLGTNRDAASIKRFWGNVAVSDPANCWLWQGSVTVHGYGQFGSHLGGTKRNWKAHRFAWFVTNGEIGDGLFVCHKCDTPLCVNPAHLFLGTCADNVADCVSKGRNARGETYGNSRLTNAEVVAIRAVWNSLPRVGSCGRRPPGSVLELARRFGVTVANIQNIVRGKSWRHLPRVPVEDVMLEVKRLTEQNR